MIFNPIKKIDKLIEEHKDADPKAFTKLSFFQKNDFVPDILNPVSFLPEKLLLPSNSAAQQVVSEKRANLPLLSSRDSYSFRAKPGGRSAAAIVAPQPNNQLSKNPLFHPPGRKKLLGNLSAFSAKGADHQNDLPPLDF